MWTLNGILTPEIYMSKKIYAHWENKKKNISASKNIVFWNVDIPTYVERRVKG